MKNIEKFIKVVNTIRELDSTIGDIFVDGSPDEIVQVEDLVSPDIDVDNPIIAAVGDVDPTNFPKAGDDLKVSLRNSEYPIFDIDFAERIKDDYPSIWDKGGNIKGNEQYRKLVPIARKNGVVDTPTEEEAVRLREAWAARHLQDFRLAGTIAQIKWLVIGERGEQYMKDLVREEMAKVDSSFLNSIITLNEDEFQTKQEAYDALSDSTKRVINKKAQDHNDEVGSDKSKRTTALTLAMVYWRGIGAYKGNPESVRPTVTSAEQWAIARVNSFLYVLKNGKFRGGKHDTDLLPRDHPMSSVEESRDLMNPQNKLSPQNKEMLLNSTKAIVRRAGVIGTIINQFEHAPAWAESKIYLAKDYVDSVATYMETQTTGEKLMNDKIVKNTEQGDVEVRHVLRGWEGLKMAPKETFWDIKDSDIEEMANVLDMETYQKAFLYVNLGGTDDPKEYRLPIAKMVDGELQIVFRGVVTAKICLQGDNPSYFQSMYYNIDQATTDDINEMYAIIGELYTSFGEEPPVMSYHEEEDERGAHEEDRGGHEEDERGGHEDDKRGGHLEDERGGHLEDERAGHEDDKERGGHMDDEERGGHLDTEEDEKGRSKMLDFVRREPKEFSVNKMTVLRHGKKSYNLSGRSEARLSVSDLKIRAVYDDNTVAETPEERVRMGRPPRYYEITGIASSTSVDHYGTEMTYEALMQMQQQFMAGVPILPRHQSLYSDGMAEWDEVIGRSYDAEVRMMNPDEMMNAYDYGEKQYVIAVSSRLYGDDMKARELIRRLDRGEPIGQSIGGWFNKMDVIENSEGEIERILVEDLSLDHLAITRAPANPDSIGLSSIRSIANSKIENFKNLVKQEIKAKQVPESMKRHIVKIVEYEDKIDICFGKSADWLGNFVEQEMPMEMEETVNTRTDEEQQVDNQVNQNIVETEKKSDVESSDNLSSNVENNSVVTEEDIITNKDDNQIDDKTLQEKSVKDNANVNEHVTIETNTTEEYEMKQEDFDKIAELMRATVAPINERIEKIESRAKVETPVQTQVQPKVETRAKLDTPELDALRKELEETRSVLNKVMAEPIRSGRHATTHVRGVGSTTAYSGLVTRAKAEGAVALSAIVEENKEVLAGEKNINLMSQHELIDLLSKGLRCAEVDGLLGTKSITDWN